MERLTERIERAPECPSGYVIAKNDRYIEAIELLADYEDTGYTPEAINVLEVKCERLQAIIKTERKINREVEGQLEEKNERLKDDCESMREALEDIAAIKVDSKYDEIYRPKLLGAVITARKTLFATAEEDDNG